MIDLQAAYGSLRAMLDEQGHKGWSCAMHVQCDDFYPGERRINCTATVVTKDLAHTSGLCPTPEAAIAALRRRLAAREPAP